MSLSRIQSLRTAAVLEDCSHQLDIMGHCLSVQISRERGATPVQEENRLIRMKSDCQLISQQMSTLSFDLEEKQSFSSLLQAVEEKERKHQEKERKRNTQLELKQKEQMVLRHKQKIQDKLDELNGIGSVWKEQKDKAVKTKDEMENVEEEMELLQTNILKEEASQDEMREPKPWQDGTWQTKSQQTKTRQAENKLQGQLELLQKQLRGEKRAHEESVKLLQNRHKELQQQLHSWKQQTKQMLQDKQKQVYNFSCKKTLNLDRLMEMRRKFMEMEQVVMEDKKEQEILFQREAEARAATKLQAWWRGCMVRRGLGAFKRAEDKKTKKKKGKKKK
ncbi:dynein regulatory complex protein 9 [Kryptolebias marmoratus]|uniref:dynein regulatory complex protein 9 n=1 Tax=Kryptolebias marmoratus TaxID=37003 RepID=UPI0007F885D9|nr:dynein regulatory complex protein 9 [Kryptolebias marmoratus]